MFTGKTKKSGSLKPNLGCRGKGFFSGWMK
jgi:hypothetical protein